MAKLTFLGAARTTTGSKHLLSWQGSTRMHRLLVDCGMFQGIKELRLRNWDPFPVNPEIIDAVILTHGHLDHCGYLPRLARMGFDGPIYGTAATLELAELILRDSAHIQEEDARHAKKWAYSKHKDPQPLYTENDVEKVIPLFQKLEYNKSYPLLEKLTVRLHHSGHILGSAFVEATVEEENKPIRVVFSGDVGRYNQPILQDPEPPTGADYFLLEGTYGDRRHSTADPLDEIADTVNRTLKRGGSVVIPAFAVGRSQQLIYYLAELLDLGRIPSVDIFLDSPMAVNVTKKTTKFHEELDLQTLLGVKEERIFKRPEVHLLATREQSMKLNDNADPCIIISASGMATAGRILHHLKRRLPGEKNTILLVGYQGEGTRGRSLLEGAPEVKIHGQMIPVKAEIVNMSSLSAHADPDEMMPWLRRMVPPAKTFLVHGEANSLEAFSEKLGSELGWAVEIPTLGQEAELPPIDPASRTPIKVVPRPRALETPPLFPSAEMLVVVTLEKEVTLPDGLASSRVFRGPLDDQVVERILSQTSAKDILLIGNGRKQDSPLLDRLRDNGRQLWQITLI